MAKIPEYLIDRIRESTDIVDIISRYVAIKKQGRNYKGICPFHTEKTPSFTVSPDKQIFYCFGCGAGGNVFNFLMRYEKSTFLEAVKKLAEETGIELPKFQEDQKQISEYDRLLRANQFAADLYQKLLKDNWSGLSNYLENRGLSQQTLSFFKIGYVPNKWDSLYSEVQAKKMSLDPFIKSGLILQSEKDSSRKYDRFRNRLMFPIHNMSGRIVAFGGRALADDPKAPKYLNSPETPIYKKSQLLFGLYFAKEWIRQEDHAIFVEGYMDYLQLFQNGIKNVTATSGTALTDEHAKLIRRHTKKVVLCYDADSAGINAALRGGQILFQNDLDVQILILPEGEDPDSFVKNQGASAFYALLNEAQDFFNFKLNHLSEKSGKENISQKTAVVNELIDSLAPHPDSLKQNFYINILSEKFSLQENTLLSELQKKKKIYNRRERKLSQDQKKTPEISKSLLKLTGAWGAEKDIIILLLNHFKEVKGFVFKILDSDDFLNDEFRKVYNVIESHQETNPEDLIHLVISTVEDEKILSLLTADLLKEIQNPERYLNDCIEIIKTTRHKNRIDYLRQQLKQYSPQDNEYKDILTEVNQNLKQIQNIRKLFTETE